MTEVVKPTLLVLAAGIGSRYGGLKQLDPVGPNGETIIDFSVYDAMRAGFGKVVFIIRKQIEKEFLSFFEGRFKGKMEMDYVYQELDILPEGYKVPEGRIKPWGTGHAVLMAKDKIKEPFAVINADDFYGPGAYTALADFFKAPQPVGIKEYALCGYQLAKTLSDFGGVSRGICETDAAGFLRKVVETHKIQKTHNGYAFPDENDHWVFLPGDTVVSMNTWAFYPEVFADFELYFKKFLDSTTNLEKAEFYIPTVADKLIAAEKARFRVLPVNEQWFGVTYPEDRPTVVEKLKMLKEQGIYPEKLW
ncbi:MAG: sugar phosphate nucleotidyltransferase [Bacteroidota bacterium]|jgi:hypothetical protein